MATSRTHQCQGSQCTDAPLPSEKIEEGTSVHRLSQGGDEDFISFERRFQGIKRRLAKPHTRKSIAYENSRFSSLLAAGDVSRGGTSAIQRQKFHTDDVKSVRNPVITADWQRSRNIVLAIVYE